MRVRLEGPRGGARGEGKLPLVFIHGAGGAATVWLDLFRHFERTRLVVAPDLPGHGQSEAWPNVLDGERVAQYADAVLAACAEAQVGRAIFVGHSMGGLVALHAAAKSDVVAAVALLNSAPGLRASQQLLDQLQLRREHQAELLAELAWSPATSRDIVERWARTVMSADPDVVLADFRAVTAAPSVDVSCRALRIMMIGGEDDLLCSPAFMRKRASSLNADLHLIAEAGHFTHLEKPVETIAALEQLLV